MSIFEYYILFAVTTAFYSTIELLNPVMQKAIEETGKPMENSVLLRIIFFIVALLTAPYLFLCCIFHEKTLLFREGLYKGLTSK